MQGTIDLSSYISVPQGLAIAIDEVDFIHQVGEDYGQDASTMLQANGSISAQVNRSKSRHCNLLEQTVKASSLQVV